MKGILNTVDIKLSKIKYSGDSVGRDIRIEIEIFGKFFRVDKRIKAGVTTEINSEVGRFETDKNFFTTDVKITVIEKDLLFNDVGSTASSIKINTESAKSQWFMFEVQVKETRLFGFWGKRTARFEITLEAEISDTLVVLTQYTYKEVNGNENYNRYDAVIKEVVDYWNNEFLKDTDPPNESLDPNLAKAIMYQESRVGHYPGAEVDVMQVGDPRNPALRTLRGELREYWIHNGKQEILKYTDAKVEMVRDSIFWGVRWLYHKVQGITTDGGRYWLKWKDAVYEYGPGMREYADSVWHIYKNGIKKENNNTIRLWVVSIILLLSTFLLWGRSSITEINTLKTTILDSFSPEQQLQIQNVEIKLYKNNTSLFGAIVEWEKDWWEKLKVGVLEGGEIKWLDIGNPPAEQSILSAQFMDLKGFPKPILEIFSKAHRGYGSLYLYEVKNDELSLIFETPAVDYYYEHAWEPDNYKKYGYGTCNRSYENGQLSAKYKDINRDGVSDLILEGKINLTCDEEVFENNIVVDTIDVKIAEMPVRQIYFWDKNRQTFLNNVVY